MRWRRRLAWWRRRWTKWRRRWGRRRKRRRWRAGAKVAPPLSTGTEGGEDIYSNASHGLSRIYNTWGHFFITLLMISTKLSSSLMYSPSKTFSVWSFIASGRLIISRTSPPSSWSTCNYFRIRISLLLLFQKLKFFFLDNLGPDNLATQTTTGWKEILREFRGNYSISNCS